MTKVFKNFEADTGKILNIVINSLYSDREIFLRELLSNASDAIQKRRYLGQTDPAVLNAGEDRITLRVDAKKKTLEIEDSGIGLSEIELAETLGTLAKSGTESFLKDLENAKEDKDAARSLIGKFGVGFYSAFMVAEKVEVLTKKAGTENAFLWTSDGQSGYEIEPSNEAQETGTRIRLHLKKDAKEFAEEARVKTIVKKYSDHISVGIHFIAEDGTSEQANKGDALWTRSPKIFLMRITKISTNHIYGFRRSLHHPAQSFRRHAGIHQPSFCALACAFDLYDPERKSKLSLYINRVFITNDLDAVLPKWLRFAGGFGYTSLDLNVSRELVNPVRFWAKSKRPSPNV